MTQPTAATNKAHAIWTLQPNGYANPERTVAKLSLVVSPRAITADGRLGGLLELADWPAQVKNLDKVSLFVAGKQGTVEARVTSPKPRSELWRTLFPPTTPVQLDGGGEVSDLDQVASSVAYGPVVSTLRGLYEQTTAARAASSGVTGPGVTRSGVTRPSGAGSPLERALSGLAQWSLAPPPVAGGEHAAVARAVVPAAAASVQAQVADLLDPTTMTTATLARAAELLREQGLENAAAMVPLVSVIRRLRSTVAPDQNGSAGNTGSRPVDLERPQPGRLDHVRAVDQADFHQVLGLVSAQPALALALGLCFDLELPALEKGEHSIRVTGGLPLLAFGGAPWSRVVADPQHGRFTMATQPRVPSEVQGGMLDLRPDGPGAKKYVVTTMDVVGTTAQLAGMASAVAAGQPAPTTLPPRRNVGFTLAQVDRRSGLVSHTAARGKAISDSFGKPESVDPVATQATPAADALASVGSEMVLYADDVTAGYRVHVRDGDGPWRSLMRRVARYTIGRERSSPVLIADDEGVVDPIPLVEQRDARGTSQLEVGETICVWNNWSLVARQPGPTVTTEADGSVRTELVARQVSANYPLRIDVSVPEGTLPRLRYGHRYQFRVFAVDLAGNSIDPALCNPAQVSAPVTYRRLDPLLAPELVLRAPLRAGEALDRVVVLSDGDGKPLGGCERHVAPPRAWFNLVELHGHFDAAMGSGSGAAQARQRLLAIGANEAGSFTDLMVPNPADPTKKIPAPGLRLAVNEDAPHPPTGSLAGLARGQALPAGEYPVHNTDAPNLPYLADPLSTGIAIAGLPTPTGEVVTARYGGSGTWPDIQPLGLIAKPGTSTGGFGVASDTRAGRPTLTLTVPPAADVTVALSSTLTPAGLALMEIDLPANAQQAALAGQEPLLTPAKQLRIVHAVRRPLLPLELRRVNAGPRLVGSTVVDLSGTVLCHPASTARVDIEATWAELVDDGSSEVRTEQRTAMIGSVPVALGTPMVPWNVRHALGDGKRRDITYRAVATTRFREYFPAGIPAEDIVRRAEAGITTVALNTTRPSPPVIHSVLPTLRWKRTLEGGVFTSVRSTAGLRVWLERPWGETGTEERLGVLIYRDLVGGAWAKEAAKNNTHPLHSRMSGWWGDPLDGWTHNAAQLVAGNFPARIEVDQSLAPQELRPSANSAPVQVGRDVLGHAVSYDRDRDLWFADIDLDITDPQMWFPFVRLAVVRHQPKSVPGCQISPVVLTDPIQLPPARTLTATWAGPGGIKLNVTGQWMNNTRFEVVVHSRAENPQLGFGGAGSEISVGGIRHRLASEVGSTTITATGTVPTTINNVPPEVPAARLVVQELQYGDYLHSSSEASRPVYVETVDEAQLRPKP